MHGVAMEIIAPAVRRYRFPVLATWQFTCVGAGDFQSLMQGLDVGMLGTMPAPPPPPAPGRKPAPPRSRSAPEVLDTGHVTLGHTDRAGETGVAWYRGPLVPRPVDRPMPGPDGTLPLLHAGDQARRVGPDGRLNLSIAAAFEIGRLLALAEPNVVAALLNWRKEGFEASRRTAVIGTDLRLELVGEIDRVRDFASRAGRYLLVDFGRDGAARFGAVRPPTDPGCPIEGIDGSDPIRLIADGFGLDAQVVKDLIAPGVLRGGGVAVPVLDRTLQIDEIGDLELAPLQLAAFDLAAQIAIDARAGRGLTGDGSGPLRGLLP
jgi:hypothetical protein